MNCHGGTTNISQSLRSVLIFRFCTIPFSYFCTVDLLTPNCFPNSVCVMLACSRSIFMMSPVCTFSLLSLCVSLKRILCFFSTFQRVYTKFFLPYFVPYFYATFSCQRLCYLPIILPILGCFIKKAHGEGIEKLHPWKEGTLYASPP